MTNLEEYFQFFRKNTIGNDQYYQTPDGRKKMIYADWAASGRMYAPIEEKLLHQFGPFVANPHTETNVSGKSMTIAYNEAKKIIKNHVGANEKDILFLEGTGMTSVIRKIQRIIGICQQTAKEIDKNNRPVVFITHMEHHSNQMSWEETCAEVVIVPPNENGDVCPKILDQLLDNYKDRRLKIGSFTACSNVTGILTPYHEMAEVMHKHGGYCFVDFSASAPYVTINMHPKNNQESLDGIFFSPHKFLGGVGTLGVGLLSKELYKNEIPDRPGGGTVNWTNPWGGKSYVSNIEEREDGGTPGFLQTIRIALAIRLKEQMTIEKIAQQDKKLLVTLLKGLRKNNDIIIFEGNKIDRLPIVSFYVTTIHHQLLVKLLNDFYGIQVRGGCSCAGTYGHYLLSIDKAQSHELTNQIDRGDLSVKPGWVRISLHPTMTTEEVAYIAASICDIVEQIENYQKNYFYNTKTNSFEHKEEPIPIIKDWLQLDK